MSPQGRTKRWLIALAGAAPSGPARLLPAVLIGTMALGACVTESVDGDPFDFDISTAEPVFIPLGADVPTTASGRAIRDYYASIVAQMQAATLDRDARWLRELLAAHQGAGRPDWVVDHMVRFDRLAATIEFENQLAERSELRIANSPRVALGETVRFLWSAPSLASFPIRLEAEADSAVAPRFLIHCTVRDFDCFGDYSRRAYSNLVTLQEAIDLSSGDRFELPFEVFEPHLGGIYRELEVRVEITPGSVLLDGESVPNLGRVCVEQGFEIFPRGIDAVIENPYTTLSQGLRSGDPEHFGHIYLAVRFMPAEHREAAIEQLIRTVRLGGPLSRRVAISALRVLTREPLTTREDWLAWHRSR